MPDERAADILEQFERLMDELSRQDLRRACFRPWEIAILVDLASCSVHRAVLQEYRTAVRHELQNGADSPMKLSEYLGRRKHAKTSVGAANAAEAAAGKRS